MASEKPGITLTGNGLLLHFSPENDEAVISSVAHDEKQHVIGKCKFVMDIVDSYYCISDCTFDDASIATSIVQLLESHLLQHNCKRRKNFLFLPLAHKSTLALQTLDNLQENITHNRVMLANTSIGKDAFISKFLPAKSNSPAFQITCIYDLPEFKQLHGDSYHNQFLQMMKESAYWLNDYELANIDKRISTLQSKLHVLVREVSSNELVGYVRLVSNGSIGYISDVVVSKNHQGKGIGSLAMEAAMRDEKVTLKHKLVFLMRASRGTIEAAEKLYYKYGFRYWPQVKQEYHNDMQFTMLANLQ